MPMVPHKASCRDEGVETLAKTIENKALTELRTVRISKNKIGFQGAIHLARVLHDCSFTELDMSENEMGSEGFVALCTQLSQCASLSELDVSDNCICNASMSILHERAANEKFQDKHPFKNLKKLFLSENDLTGGVLHP